MSKIFDKIKNDPSFILTFIIIFVSNDTLLFGTNNNGVFFWIHVGILLATFFYILVRLKSIQKNILFFVMFIMSCIILTMLVNNDDEFMKYVYNIFMVLFCALFCEYITAKKFSQAFVDIIYYLSAFSIGLFLLWIFAAPVVRLFPSILNMSGIRYYYLGFGFLENLRDGALPRMYGIFREPGVFACYLSLALIFQLYFEKKLNIKRVVVIFIAALLTFSTAIYITMSIILSGYFLFQLLSKHKQKRGVWLGFALSVAFAIVFFAIGPERIISLVFEKLTFENASRDSRLGAIAANLKMFWENPVFGKGWDFVEDNFVAFTNTGTYKGHHNTNTFLKFLAVYGAVPFTCICSLVASFFVKGSKSVVRGLLIMLIWMVALSNEDLINNILFYILPLYSFKKKGSFA